MKLTFNIVETINRLIAQEDTDHDNKITIEDKGPKLFNAISIDGKSVEIKGAYFLSNFLQELILAKELGNANSEINFENVFEEPVKRLNRMIKDYYWNGLTRKIDADGLKEILVDSKSKTKKFNLYIPHNDKTAFEYFTKVAAEIKNFEITVLQLPLHVTPEYVYSINSNSGVLGLALKKNYENKLVGVPFVVPGGRFNEMYGWDSYFESLGLVIDGRIDLAKSMAENFVYEIEHYGKILNANRTYYLTRSQPPFLTSLTLLVYNSMPKTSENNLWLEKLLNACIKEYQTVWMNEPKITSTKLSRYFGAGIGLVPEAELNHFDAMLKPYAEQAKMTVREYHSKYLNREIINPEIEEYIKHDRSIRESGHDTSYRLDKICANLNTVDLNSLLYKYEIDIAEIIKNEFSNYFVSYDGKIELSGTWFKKAEERKNIINNLMWNNEKGFFFDYNFVKNEQTNFESATTFYPLWAKLATQDQADQIVKKALPVLEFAGGIAGTSKNSVGTINDERPQKQWDYPNGWAPHQILIWEGLINYGYDKVAERLAYKWLYMILKNAVDYNGTVPEKYDVVSRTHKVFAEYGNVGTDFDYITKEGFGWMNASFKVGQKYLSENLINKLNNLIPPEELF
ncbi:MAG: trehalase [Ignavibacteriae bacterium]|nr:trehalase [Ignavibacteriota bacterium]